MNHKVKKIDIIAEKIMKNARNRKVVAFESVPEGTQNILLEKYSIPIAFVVSTNLEKLQGLMSKIYAKSLDLVMNTLLFFLLGDWMCQFNWY